MSSHARVPAVEPEDLERHFVERVNAGDVEGLVELYEPDAVMAFLPGMWRLGARQSVRCSKLTLGDQQPALRVGELALGSTRLIDGGVTAEVARRQTRRHLAVGD